MSMKNKGKKYQPKLSLKPLRFEEAMKLLLKTKLVKKKTNRHKDSNRD